VDGAVLSCRSRNIAKVLSCYDGDTCRLEREILHGRDRVRLANADTPEIEGRCQEEIDRAVMARDYTRALVAGRVVTLSAIQPDKYRKRIDAYVSIDGRDLGDALRGPTAAAVVKVGVTRPRPSRESCASWRGYRRFFFDGMRHRFGVSFRSQ
jgi:endonuclease YncB( thermonuclease family)